jgi:hypothetical protein
LKARDKLLAEWVSITGSLFVFIVEIINLMKTGSTLAGAGAAEAVRERTQDASWERGIDL